MKSAAAERVVISVGVQESAEYGIDPAQVAHIMGILRSSLYTRKALAILREYSSNAWDAHRMSGKPELPIKVTIPTYMEPTFRCRDFGPGLSRQDVLYVYTQYGASTKRDTNLAVGALGIGSKSAFCMSDSFTITSWHGGTKAVYVAALDKSNKGRMELLHEEDCGDETGIEIKVAIPSSSVWDFEREAKALFRYMRPQPEINVVLPPLPEGLKHGFIHKDNHANWIGVMGCVPYRIDLAQLQDGLVKAGLWDALQKLGGGLYLPIGEVEFAANREELQYTDVTVAAILGRFKALVKNYVDDALASLKDGQGTGWERRHKAVFLSGLGFRLPKRYNEWTRQKVALFNRDKGVSPKHFDLLGANKAKTHLVPVNQSTRLLLADPTDTRKMEGWRLHSGDLIVKPLNGHTLVQAGAELDKMLSAAQLDGISLGMLSARSWYAPASKSGRRPSAYNAKHKQHTFTMVNRYTNGTLSKNWEKAEPPQDDHCYFIINRFQVDGCTSFYQTVVNDMALARAFDLPFPEVYGYKTTDKRPIEHKDIEKGTPYMKWRKQFFAELMTPQCKQQIRDLQWAGLFANFPYQFTRRYPGRDGLDMNWNRNLPKLIEKLSDALGEKHPVVRYFVSHRLGCKAVRKFKRGLQAHLETLMVMYPGRNKRTAPQCAFDRLLAAYPMLAVTVETDNDMHVFQTHTDALIHYISTIDGAQN